MKFFFFTQFVHYLPLHRMPPTHPAASPPASTYHLCPSPASPSLSPIHLFPLPNLYYPPPKFSFFLHLFLFLSHYLTSSASSSTSSATARHLLLLPTFLTSPLHL